jgi:ABC-2 type transport system ATP-binding protein
MVFLETVGLRRSFEDVLALDGVDLEVEQGQILALLGPNGAGKSTFISTVAGLLRPDEGSVMVGGISVLHEPRRAQRLLGLAPQELGIYPLLSCEENLLYFAQLAGMSRREARTRSEEIAEVLGLTPELGRSAYKLSGGQKRRLHTAAALVHRPPLLLLDEPTAGADPATRNHLLDLVKQLAAEGSTVVYTTHYLNEVEVFDARVAIIDRGRLMACAPLDELLAAHAHAAVELRFTRPLATEAVELFGDRASLVGPDVARVTAADAPAAVPQVLAALGRRSESLESIQIIRPGLEAVFLTLTGRRYEGEARQARPAEPAQPATEGGR